VLLLGLSSGHKLGLALAGAIFAGFSLIVSMLIPRWRPQFPGRGLPVFLVVVFLLFLGMLASVEIFGKESSEAAGEHETTSTAQTATAQTTTTTASTSTATTTTTAAPSVQKIDVTESEWKIVLPKTKLSAGKYEFDVKNDGKFAHDLTIKGAGVSAATPTFNAGQTAKLTVDLKPGSYDFYCSIPGHKQAGMDQKVTVS
jgi:uncharacterized cupredoxin-like copper-binding protein